MRKLYINNKQGEIIINFDNKYKIKTIPLFCSILLVFNGSNKFSFNQIMEKTLIEKKLLEICLKNLLFGDNEILKKFPENLEIKDDHEFYINPNYSSNSKIIEISLNNDYKKKINLKNKIDTFRKIRIEACIVKIMKKNNELSHQNIINKTKENLFKFETETKIIEECISNLIDREYIEKKLEDLDIQIGVNNETENIDVIINVKDDEIIYKYCLI